VWRGVRVRVVVWMVVVLVGRTGVRVRRGRLVFRRKGLLPLRVDDIHHLVSVRLLGRQGGKVGIVDSGNLGPASLVDLSRFRGRERHHAEACRDAVQVLVVVRVHTQDRLKPSGKKSAGPAVQLAA
jgi:hypothetical protein